MLSEIRNVHQIPGEGYRCWFTNTFFDLIIWYNDQRIIKGFQLCYNKNDDEHAVTWHKDSGFSHTEVDNGEDELHFYKMTPILISDGIFENKKIAEKFQKESQKIDPDIASFVLEKLIEYPTSKNREM